jgi:hypothetical protein
MPKAHYFPSRTTGDKAFLARASTDKSGQGLAAAWLIGIAIIASWMLALLFPPGLSFANSRHDSPTGTTSYPSDHFLKGDRSQVQELKKATKFNLSVQGFHASAGRRSDVIWRSAGS